MVLQTRESGLQDHLEHDGPFLVSSYAKAFLLCPNESLKSCKIDCTIT